MVLGTQRTLDMNLRYAVCMSSLGNAKVSHFHMAVEKCSFGHRSFFVFYLVE
jgi:hypothetical protein